MGQGQRRRESGREGTYLKVIIKHSIHLWNNEKSQRIIIHAPRCALQDKSINQGQEGLTKFYSIFVGFFKESDKAHNCPSVATT